MNILSKLAHGIVTLGVLATTTAFAGNKLHFNTTTIDTDSVTELSSVISAQSAKALNTEYFVVQFEDKITDEDRLYIESITEIINYIPDDAYLVKLSNADLLKVRQRKNIQTILPYFAQLKISNNFETRSVFNSTQKVQVAIILTSEDVLDSVLSKMNKDFVKSAEGKSILVEATLGDLEKIAEIDGVAWVSPYSQPSLMEMKLQMDGGFKTQARMRSLNELTGYESGTRIMGFERAWAYGFSGANQIVAMADTGLDTGNIANIHPDFAGTLGGKAYGLFSRDWSDPMGHGTHVAGSVMGNGAQSGGMIRGGAFNAKMVAQGMWSPMLNNLSVPQDLKGMFQDAYNMGARIHTNSWGSARNFGAYDNYATQVDEFTWMHPDMLVLFAAGNSGGDLNKDGRIDPGTVSSPGTAKNVLTVGASENYLLEGGNQTPLLQLRPGPTKWSVEPLASDTLSNNPNGIAAFSSRGPTLDGRLKPEVVAPGTNIVSLCSTIDGSSDMWGRFNEDYCYSGGTSMSTPLVAGGAAVIREYLQYQGVRNPSAALLKAILMGTADDLYPGQYGYREFGQEILQPGPDVDQGFGRVNISNAVHDYRYASINEAEVGMGQDFEVVISAYDVDNLKIVAVYTDAPGAASSARNLVNDLDMYINIPGSDNTIRLENRVNNFEFAHVVGLQDVEYIKVTIKAHNLPMPRGNGKLPFALVAIK